MLNRSWPRSSRASFTCTWAGKPSKNLTAGALPSAGSAWPENRGNKSHLPEAFRGRRCLRSAAGRRGRRRKHHWLLLEVFGLGSHVLDQRDARRGDGVTPRSRGEYQRQPRRDHAHQQHCDQENGGRRSRGSRGGIVRGSVTSRSSEISSKFLGHSVFPGKTVSSMAQAESLPSLASVHRYLFHRHRAQRSQNVVASLARSNLGSDASITMKNRSSVTRRNRSLLNSGL